MKNKSNMFKKAITILTILTLLIMILPMSIMAKDRTPNTLPSQASDKAQQDSKSPQPKVTGVNENRANDKKSGRALLVAARNEWAKSTTIGLPPGHANLMIKYIIAKLDPVDLKALNPTVISFRLTMLFDSPEFNANFYDAVTKRLDVKALMGAIKGMKIMASEVADDKPAA